MGGLYEQPKPTPIKPVMLVRLQPPQPTFMKRARKRCAEAVMLLWLWILAVGLLWIGWGRR